MPGVAQAPLRSDSPTLTSEAEAALAQLIDQHCRDLKDVGRSLAAKEELDHVSAIHVRRAKWELRHSRPTSKRSLGTLGGLLAGASLPNLLSHIASGEAIDVTVGFIYVTLLVAGSFLIAAELGGRGRGGSNE
jgi:hypothetical protein